MRFKKKPLQLKLHKLSVTDSHGMDSRVNSGQKERAMKGAEHFAKEVLRL